MRRFVPVLVLTLAVAHAQAQTPAAAPTADPAIVNGTTPALNASPPATSDTATHPPRSGHTKRISWEQRFAEANTTHDGHLTLAQAKAGDPALARHFAAIDQDKKGYITEDDVRNYRKMQRALHHQSAQGKPGAS